MKSTFFAACLLIICCSLVRAEYESVDITPVRNRVTIRMGQHRAFIFDRRGDRLVNPRPAPKATKQPLVSARLIKWKGHTILRMLNTFPQVVRYHSAARGPGSGGYRRVNRMFGLVPGVIVEEMIKLPISEFVLYDFTLRKERTDSMTTNETIGW